MKTFTKVLCYIQGVLGAIYAIVFLFGASVIGTLITSIIDSTEAEIETATSVSHTGAFFSILLGIGIFLLIGIFLFSIFLCFFVPSRLDKAKCKKDIIVWGVLSLIFINILVGILILCMEEEEYIPEVKKIDAKK